MMKLFCKNNRWPLVVFFFANIRVSQGSKYISRNVPSKLGIKRKVNVLSDEASPKLSRREKSLYSEFLWFVFSRIHSECGKIRTRKNSKYGRFSRSCYCYQLLSVVIIVCYYHVTYTFQSESKLCITRTIYITII